MKKTIFLILTLVFFLFAAVQYNDPDPFLWMALYGYVMVMCYLAFNQIFYKPLILIGLAASVIWFLYDLQDGIAWYNQGMPNITGAMKAETPLIELMRELLGVLLCVITLLFIYFQSKRAQR